LTRIVLALNVDSENAALEMYESIGNRVDCYKIGIDLFARTGPALVRDFVRRKADVFLDLKYSDIPSVVAKAVEAAADMGVAMLTVHTMGGPAMLAAAAKAADAAKGRKPLVLGVTVLTSLDEAALERVSGMKQPVAERVSALALMAKECGCGGVVCSPQEIGALRQACGREFTVVTPGIRLGPAKDDQARTLTPAEAAQAGADYIVVGRPIYEARDPLKAIAEIRAQMGGAGA
jgi:orotidine-5'-phosphate decarboxylase